MKPSTALALAGLGGLAWYLSRSGQTAPTSAGASDGSTNPLGKPGDFDPSTAKNQPDYATVIDGYDIGDYFLSAYHEWEAGDLDVEARKDWMYFGDCPQGGINGAYAQDYYRQMWLPASRINPTTLTQGDFRRAAAFLGGAWKKGAGAGAVPEFYDKNIGHINDELDSEASGLDIGTKIGVGLASIFGFGQGAAAADSGFGFGRGAAEDRAGIIDLNAITTPAGDVGIASAFGAPRANPDGTPVGAQVLSIGTTLTLACFPNLFYAQWRKYDTSWQSKTITTRLQFHDATGQAWIRLGYAYPWYSAEMGANLSLPERIYCRARMMRCLDIISAKLYPTDALSTTNTAIISSGDTADIGSVVKNYRWTYNSVTFGPLGGSIFPIWKGDQLASALGNGTSNEAKRRDSQPVPAAVATAGATHIDRAEVDALVNSSVPAAGATAPSAAPAVASARRRY